MDFTGYMQLTQIRWKVVPFALTLLPPEGLLPLLCVLSLLRHFQQLLLQTVKNLTSPLLHDPLLPLRDGRRDLILVKRSGVARIHLLHEVRFLVLERMRPLHLLPQFVDGAVDVRRLVFEGYHRGLLFQPIYRIRRLQLLNLLLVHVQDLA